MQKRLVRKLDLEKALSKIKAHPEPRAYLEQYTIPVGVAVEILFIAAYVNDDIIDKKVIDLGCGTGRLAIGAALLGARETVGIDIDTKAVKIAYESAEELSVKEMTNWVTGNIDVIHGSFDTVLQNPPFGVQRRRADRKFVDRSLELGYRVYSLHKSAKRNREFIKRFIEKRGGKVMNILPLKMHIPKLFEFHTKRKHTIQVDLYRIAGKARQHE